MSLNYYKYSLAKSIMIYSILYLSPVWKNTNPRNRYYGIITIGTIIYIILQTCINMKYADQADKKYYIYFTAFVDSMFVAYLHYRSRKNALDEELKKAKKRNKYILQTKQIFIPTSAPVQEPIKEKLSEKIPGKLPEKTPEKTPEKLPNQEKPQDNKLQSENIEPVIKDEQNKQDKQNKQEQDEHDHIPVYKTTDEIRIDDIKSDDSIPSLQIESDNISVYDNIPVYENKKIYKQYTLD